MTWPLVSVVVVNYNGARHLEACFASLLAQNYPSECIELILVDNGSRDGSLELMAGRFPAVKIVANDTNRGFSPAVNQGAAAATGAYVALINNDARANADWLRAMVEQAEAWRDEGVVCIGAVMLDWEGQRIDFVGGGINFYGHGHQIYHNLPLAAIKPVAGELLFACGGAMLVDRQVFLDLGGFDDDYFAYFEDIDFGWRLWVAGYRVRLAPDAIVYHRLHGTSGGSHDHGMRALLERNALLTVIKNYDDSNLQRVLPAALLLLISRSLTDGAPAIDRRDFDLRKRAPDDADQTVEVPKTMLSYLVAAGDLIAGWDRVWEKRKQVQARRSRPDSEILPLFTFARGTNFPALANLLLQESVSEAFGIDTMFEGTKSTRVLIISSDPLSAKLAGPGIRAYEMARYLSEVCTVTLAAPDRADVELPNVTVVPFERADKQMLWYLGDQSDILVVQGHTLSHYPKLRELQRIMVVDMYDPFHLENLEIHTTRTPENPHIGALSDLRVINDQLDAGDYFICAGERQRDLWLGALGSLGRLAPENYVDDPTFRSLIDVVPFGLAPTPPQKSRPVLKGVVPGIEPNDFVLLWGGGIWEWLDPLTVIRAMRTIGEQRPDIKLFFLGQQHPNTVDVPPMLMYERAVGLAEELGLRERSVFFNPSWVPYAERADYLLEADIGLSAHGEHLETRFAFRTRLLDYIWAGLPMVVSAGDTLADVVAQRGLGMVAPIGDSDAFAEAVLHVAAMPRSSYAEAFGAARHDFAWPQALRPLLEFCRRPRHAPDKQRRAYYVGGLKPLLNTGLRPADYDEIIKQKNDHIAHLEGLIRQIQGGRVMKLMNGLSRQRGRRARGGK